MKRIEISEETYKKLEKLAWGFEVTPDSVVNMLISKYYEKSDKTENQTVQKNHFSLTDSFDEEYNFTDFYHTKNTPFRIGTKLRYKSKPHIFANVQAEGFNVNGKVVKSPSAAAKVVTGNEVAGWQAWEYFDEEANIWREINYLRELHK
jgi:hypothetical protein